MGSNKFCVQNFCVQKYVAPKWLGQKKCYPKNTWVKKEKNVWSQKSRPPINWVPKVWSTSGPKIILVQKSWVQKNNWFKKHLGQKN